MAKGRCSGTGRHTASLLLTAVCAASVVTACASSAADPAVRAGATPVTGASQGHRPAAATPSVRNSASASPRPKPSPKPKPTPTLAAHEGAAGQWQVLVRSGSRPVVETQMLSTGASVAVVRFDGPTSQLVLHAGYQDPGGQWLAGPEISGIEQQAGLRGAFNGGFRLNVGAGGFFEGGRSAAALVPGDASVVTYADGTTDIGVWGRDVPAGGKAVVSVRQNLHLLVDQGQLAPDIDQYGPWGATLGGGFAVARSALGIDRYGNLLWAGSSYSTPRALATALVLSGAVRALQLDINPEWVAGFVFVQGQQRAVLPSQSQPIGTFLSPYSRDFFVVIARSAAAASG